MLRVHALGLDLPTPLGVAAGFDKDARLAGPLGTLGFGFVEVGTLTAQPPEYVSTAKVFDMLMAVPKLGRVKAARLLNTCRISQSKTVGGLSDRQRHELIALFNR